MVKGVGRIGQMLLNSFFKVRYHNGSEQRRGRIRTMRNNGHSVTGCRLVWIQEHVKVDVNLDATLAQLIARDGLKIASAAFMLHAFELGLISAHLAGRRMFRTALCTMGMALSRNEGREEGKERPHHDCFGRET